MDAPEIVDRLTAFIAMSGWVSTAVRAIRAEAPSLPTQPATSVALVGACATLALARHRSLAMTQRYIEQNSDAMRKVFYI